MKTDNLVAEIEIVGASVGVAEDYQPPAPGEGRVLVRDIVEQLDDARRWGIPVVLLVVDSCGGDAYAGPALYHALRCFSEDGGKVVAFVPGPGQASSCAVEWVLGADYVVAAGEALFGLHGSGRLQPGTTEFVDLDGEDVELVDELNAAQASVLCARTLADEDRVMRWCGPPQDAEILDAAQAQRLGLVDVVGGRRVAQRLARELALGRVPTSSRQEALRGREVAETRARWLGAAVLERAMAPIPLPVPEVQPAAQLHGYLNAMLSRFMAAHADARVLRDEGFRNEALRRIIKTYALLMASGVIADALVGKGPPDYDEDGEVGALDAAKWAGLRAVLFPAETLPVVPGFLEQMVGSGVGRDPSLLPFSRALKIGAEAGASALRAAEEEAPPEAAYRAAWQALEAFGWYEGLPVAQMRRTGNYWFDLSPDPSPESLGLQISEEAAMAGPLERVVGTVYGPKRPGRLGEALFGAGPGR